jgi:hypothetical protein
LQQHAVNGKEKGNATQAHVCVCRKIIVTPQERSQTNHHTTTTTTTQKHTQKKKKKNRYFRCQLLIEYIVEEDEQTQKLRETLVDDEERLHICYNYYDYDDIKESDVMSERQKMFECLVSFTVFTAATACLFHVSIHLILYFLTHGFQSAVNLVPLLSVSRTATAAAAVEGGEEHVQKAVSRAKDTSIREGAGRRFLCVSE